MLKGNTLSFLFCFIALFLCVLDLSAPPKPRRLGFEKEEGAEGTALPSLLCVPGARTDSVMRLGRPEEDYLDEALTLCQDKALPIPGVEGLPEVFSAGVTSPLDKKKSVFDSWQRPLTKNWTFRDCSDLATLVECTIFAVKDNFQMSVFPGWRRDFPEFVDLNLADKILHSSGLREFIEFNNKYMALTFVESLDIDEFYHCLVKWEALRRIVLGIVCSIISHRIEQNKMCKMYRGDVVFEPKLAQFLAGPESPFLWLMQPREILIKERAHFVGQLDCKSQQAARKILPIISRIKCLEVYSRRPEAVLIQVLGRNFSAVFDK